MPTIFLATPHYDGKLHGGAAMGAFIPAFATSRQDVQIMPRNLGGSLLAFVFNRLWAEALCYAAVGKVDYFVMLHADVCPVEGWLDTLVGECERLNADVVSTVIPIKQSGVPWEKIATTTAVGTMDDTWHPTRKLTLGECHSFPPTFSIADTPWPKQRLLVNTGCWIADLRKPFWLETYADGKLKHYFTIRDGIKLHGRFPDGRLQIEPLVESEDWGFSRRLPVDAKVYATTAVKVVHVGEAKWRNWMPDVQAGVTTAEMKPELATAEKSC